MVFRKSAGRHVAAGGRIQAGGQTGDFARTGGTVGKNKKTLLLVCRDEATLAAVRAQFADPTSDGRFELEVCGDWQQACTRDRHFAAIVIDFCPPVSAATALPADFVATLDALRPGCAGILLAEREEIAAATALIDGRQHWRVVAKPWRQDELALLVAETIRYAATVASAAGPALPRPTATTLRTAPVLAELPDHQLDILAAVTAWRRHAPGESLMRQNEHSGTVLFIVSGFAKIVRGGVHAQPPAGAPVSSERRARPRLETMVALIGPGDILGEVATLLGTGRSASVVALTPCEVIELPSQDFLSCMQRYPQFALAVARKLAKRLVDASRQVELMRGDLAGRIHALIRNCREQGLDTERWLSNAEIARMVGASRVAVSQIVSRTAGSSGNFPQSLTGPAASVN